MQTETTEIPEQLIIAVYDGASESILDIDFSFLNLKVYHLSDNALKDYIDSISYPKHEWAETNYRIFDNWYRNDDRGSGVHPFRWAFVPIDVTKLVSDDFHLIRDILLIMYPSDFNLMALVNYDQMDTNTQFTLSHFHRFDTQALWWIKGNTATADEFLFKIKPPEKQAANDFFKLCWKQLPNMTYLNLGITSYIANFTIDYVPMKFINLCITLESLLTGSKFITHRISKTVSMLLAKDSKEGTLFYKNMELLYDVRSRIVHGDTFKNSAPAYFDILYLVSSVLIELVLLNITSRGELKRFVTKYKYGQQANYNNTYIDQVFNEKLTTEIRTDLSTKIQK